jgi:hypothetical protein
VQAETSPLSPEDQAIATANEAMALSTAALTAAWAGTQSGNVAYGLATYAISIAGTAGGGSSPEAYNLGRTALDTAWVGTSSAAEAYALASSAYTLATIGTQSYAAVVPDTGTVTFDMAGAAYQSAVISGTTAVSVSNIVAPSETTGIRTISARLQHDYTGTQHVLTWEPFSYVGANPPLAIPTGKSLFVSFTSYGATVQNVFVAVSSQV